MTGVAVVDKVISIIYTVFLIAVVSIFIYTEFIYKRPLPEDEWEFIKMQEEINREITGKTFKLEKLIINLMSRPGRLRYLNVTVHFLPIKDKYFPMLEKNSSLVYDCVIRVVSKTTPEEINSVAGKIYLENRIKKEVNAAIGETIVKKIYFTSFVVD